MGIFFFPGNVSLIGTKSTTASLGLWTPGGSGGWGWWTKVEQEGCEAEGLIAAGDPAGLPGSGPPGRGPVGHGGSGAI